MLTLLSRFTACRRWLGISFRSGSFESDSAWSLATSLVSRSSTLLLLFYAAAVLSVSEFGVFALAHATVYLFFPFALAGLNLSGARMAATCARDGTLAGTVSVQSLQVTLSSTMLAVLVVSSGWGWIMRITGTIELDGGIRGTSCLHLATLTISSSVCSIITGFKQFRVLFWASVAGLVGMAISAPYSIAAGGVRGAQIAAAVCHGATLGVALFHNRRNYRRFFHTLPDFRVWGQLFSLGGPTYVMTILAGVTNYLAIALITRQVNGTVDLAAYTICDRIRQMLILPMTAAAPVLLSHLASAKGEGRMRTIRRMEAWVAAATTLPSILVMATGGLLLSMFGHGFHDSRSLLLIAAAGATPYVLNTLYGYVLIAEGEVMERFKYDLVLAAILLAGIVPLIAVYGSKGYVAAQLLGYSALAVALRLRIRIKTGVGDRTPVLAQ